MPDTDAYFGWCSDCLSEALAAALPGYAYSGLFHARPCPIHGDSDPLPIRAEPMPAHAIEFARVNGDAIPDAELHADEPADLASRDGHAVARSGTDRQPDSNHCRCGAPAHPYHCCRLPGAETITDQTEPDSRPCRQCAAAKRNDGNTYLVFLEDNDGHRHAYYPEGGAIEKPERPRKWSGLAG